MPKVQHRQVAGGNASWITPDFSPVEGNAKKAFRRYALWYPPHHHRKKTLRIFTTPHRKNRSATLRVVPKVQHRQVAGGNASWITPDFSPVEGNAKKAFRRYALWYPPHHHRKKTLRIFTTPHRKNRSATLRVVPKVQHRQVAGGNASWITPDFSPVEGNAKKKRFGDTLYGIHRTITERKRSAFSPHPIAKIGAHHSESCQKCSLAKLPEATPHG